MVLADRSLALHEAWRGKIEVRTKVPLGTHDDLALAYTPGVAEPCRRIAQDASLVYDYTIKGRAVAVVTDGSAVLGLGNIGPLAALPVMEGKAALFREFGGIDAFPLCLDTQDVDEIVDTVVRVSPAFGGINLEDISAPRCFEIERRLVERLDIPVFHDDQHGTAIVVLSGLINALKVVGKEVGAVRVVINGAGAAGAAIAKLMLRFGFKHIVLCNSKGIVSSDSLAPDDPRRPMLAVTNLAGKRGLLADAMRGADVVIGVSAPRVITAQMVASMADDPIVFALSNPEPEIHPDEAKMAGARIVGTGRSDFPNQVNNVLAFPGIFKGALQARAGRITEDMKVAAALAIAGLVPDEELSEDCVIPDPFDPRVAECVSDAVRSCVLASEGC